MRVKITEECILDRPFRKETRTQSLGEEDCQNPPLHLEIQTRRFHHHVEEKKEEHEHPIIFFRNSVNSDRSFVVLGETAVECAVD